ncbi:MAG TPA: hypothetical protein VGR35_23545 [Tepidisphaeraceae bacterium]|nr:hypothetical protein [Tepidisphaeraceae bacterium]
MLCRNGAGRLLGIPSSGSFEFGESKLVLEIDGTKSQHYPPHTLSVYVGDELLAKYKNVGFDKVYASKDNKFFVGVSNGGIPGTAFVVFDAEGNLLREEKHRFLPRALYTSQSVTVIRVWYDRENPNVEFDVRDGRLLAVFIRGSNNQRYNLLERDLGFREVPAER